MRDSERICAWLFTIARNAIVDYRRSRRPTLDLEAAAHLEQLQTANPLDVASDGAPGARP